MWDPFIAIPFVNPMITSRSVGMKMEFPEYLVEWQSRKWSKTGIPYIYIYMYTHSLIYTWMILVTAIEN